MKFEDALKSMREGGVAVLDDQKYRIVEKQVWWNDKQVSVMKCFQELSNYHQKWTTHFELGDEDIISDEWAIENSYDANKDSL